MKTNPVVCVPKTEVVWLCNVKADPLLDATHSVSLIRSLAVAQFTVTPAAYPSLCCSLVVSFVSVP